MRKTLAALALVASALTGCSCNNTDALREHTADATAAVKRDSGAIASGIVEGLKRKGPLDINAASKRDLEALPGITSELAGKIIAGRPYTQSDDLYHKHILTRAQYNRIRSQIATHH